MANYLLQADGSSTCCTCPTRVSPCDNCGSTGACCNDDGTCNDLTEADCTAAGGTFHGLGTTCADVDCTQGPCCALDGSGDCTITTPDDCGGSYIGGGLTCADVDCTQGACCVDAHCSITTESGCAMAGGTYSGNGTVCVPNPCFSGCSDCFGITPLCVDDDGNCWTGLDPTLPLPSCFGEMVDCSQQFLTQITTCVTPPACIPPTNTGTTETINPETCVDTSTGDGCFPCNSRNELFDPYIPCPAGFLPPP